MTDLETFDQRQQQIRIFGLALVMVAESMIFVPLFAIRFLVAGTDIPTSADTTTAILLTVTMIVSFSAMYGARRSRGTDSSARTSSLLITAAAFALATAIGTGIGWAASDVAASSPYGGVFYLTTGAHAIHLVIAAAFALGLSAQVRRGTIARTSPTHVDLAYWFWVFLLVLWLAIDAVFYVI